MKKYLITDPEYYTTDPSSFSAVLNRSLLKYKPDFVCFRDKSEGSKDKLLDIFTDAMSKTNAVSLVNGSLELALRYNLAGVHLRGNQQHLIHDVKKAGLLCIASTHSLHEARNAFELGCDYVTLSPVFDTPNKGKPIGFETFLGDINKLEGKKVFALGGIDNEDKEAILENNGVFGFASIRYFVR